MPEESRTHKRADFDMPTRVSLLEDDMDGIEMIGQNLMRQQRKALFMLFGILVCALGSVTGLAVTLLLRFLGIS